MVLTNRYKCSSFPQLYDHCQSNTAAQIGATLCQLQLIRYILLDNFTRCLNFKLLSVSQLANQSDNAVCRMEKHKFEAS